jgi:hypothetical protein
LFNWLRITLKTDHILSDILKNSHHSYWCASPSGVPAQSYAGKAGPSGSPARFHFLTSSAKIASAFKQYLNQFKKAPAITTGAFLLR